MSCKSILVVDDDFDLRQNIVQALESAGYTIYQATNGVEALQLLREHRQNNQIGCIILDMMMPVMDGATFLQVFKNDLPDLYTQTPVIIATAAGSPINPLKVPTDCERIQKPMDLDELYAVVKRHCGGPVT